MRGGVFRAIWFSYSHIFFFLPCPLFFAVAVLKNSFTLLGVRTCMRKRERENEKKARLAVDAKKKRHTYKKKRQVVLKCASVTSTVAAFFFFVCFVFAAPCRVSLPSAFERLSSFSFVFCLFLSEALSRDLVLSFFSFGLVCFCLRVCVCTCLQRYHRERDREWLPFFSISSPLAAIICRQIVVTFSNLPFFLLLLRQ